MCAGERVWIVLDGPCDQCQLEGLQTVLDDNRMLCLASGDRLTMSSQCRLVFEVDSLDHLSPGFVSQCGLVSFNQYCIDWRTIFQVCQNCQHCQTRPLDDRTYCALPAFTHLGLFAKAVRSFIGITSQLPNGFSNVLVLGMILNCIHRVLITVKLCN